MPVPCRPRSMRVPRVPSRIAAASASEPNGSVYLRTNGDIVGRRSAAWEVLFSGGRASNLATAAMFRSTPQTGTGSPQNIAHGFGSTPSIVFAFATAGHNGSGAAGTQMPTLTPGTHDATNAIFTCTAGATYIVVCFR